MQVVGLPEWSEMGPVGPVVGSDASKDLSGDS